MMLRHCALCCLLVLISLTAHGSEHAALTYIQNDHIKIGILGKAGGRIVALHYQNSDNLIYADKQMWSQPAWTEITITPRRWGVYPGYYGHSMWIGPQDQWYNQQELYPYMHNKTWPPDKHLNVTQYTVLNQEKDRIALLSPASPISGLSLQKNYKVDGQTVSIDVQAKNTGDKVYTWNLWSLLRMPTKAAVWIHPGDKQRIEKNKHDGTDLIMRSHQGWQYLDRSTYSEASRCGKLFSDCQTPVIVAFSAQHCIIISFNKIKQANLPKAHQNIEIFEASHKDPSKKSFIELEHHGALHSVAPNESFQHKEQWRIVPYSGGDDKDAQFAFIQSQLH